MKKFIYILALLCCLDLIAIEHQDNLSCDSPSLNSLYRTLPDSLYSIIRDKPLILYMSGHTGHIWSLILKKDSSYQILTGVTEPLRINNLYEPTKSGLIDTAGFLSAHKEILAWGLDSLPSQSKSMKPVYRKEYTPIYTQLSIIKQDSTKFNSKGAIAFSGKDSVEFNTKFNRLYGIMYWLAMPLVRKYTPDSIYIVDQNKYINDQFSKR